jgi:hypothetical protein
VLGGQKHSISLDDMKRQVISGSKMKSSFKNVIPKEDLWKSKVASLKPTMMYICYSNFVEWVSIFCFVLNVGLLANFHLFNYLNFIYLFIFCVEWALRPKFSGPIMWLFFQNPQLPISQGIAF